MLNHGRREYCRASSTLGFSPRGNMGVKQNASQRLLSLDANPTDDLSITTSSTEALSQIN